MAASFPTSVKSFSTKADNVDDVMAVDVNGIQDEVVAIETHLLTNYSVWKYLTTPLTSTDFDGDSFSTASKTLIDLSDKFSVPAGVTAILATLQARDEASASSNCYFALAPNNTDGQWALMVKPYNRVNDTYEIESGVVPCDSNGDVYYQTVASGSGTLDVIMEIWGYAVGGS